MVLILQISHFAVHEKAGHCVVFARSIHDEMMNWVRHLIPIATAQQRTNVARSARNGMLYRNFH